MDIAVLSDIHGNYVALKRCVEYALERNIKTFIFLGDYVGEMAYPQRMMDLLYSLKEEYNCYFIKGNRDDYVLNYRKKGEKGWKDKDSTTGALFYTYHNLRKEDLDFYEGLSHRQVLKFEGMPPLTVCHGSPDKNNEKLLPDNENTFAVMEKDENSIILCGHTHVQRVIEHSGKVVLNPGSVGVPLKSDGKTQFMILHGNDGLWDYEFLSLEYDVEKVISQLRESGLTESAPCWCKVTERLLRTGAPSHGTVLERAMELCKIEMGECVWPDVSEKYWEQAVVEML